MANYNLTNQPISSSFGQLLQKDVTTSTLYDGTGSVVSELDITSSYALTASYAENVVDPTWDNIQDKPNGLVSGSTQIILEDTTGNLSGSRIEGAVALATNATSASYAIISDNALEIFVLAKNTSGHDIPKGYAVHSSGVTGDKINISTASYDDPTLMPAIGITQEAISNNAVGEVILTGRIQSINTSNLTPGATVYVNGDGALTSTKPTGSALIQNIGTCVKSNATEGEVLVLGSGRSNDVPNIQEGYAWVGNSNGLATAISTASWDSHSDLTSLNAFTQSQENLNATFATTGSNTFNGDQTISGSVTIQDTNAPMSGLVLKNNSGGGDVQIIPAGDLITTFNAATLTGINIYGGDKISGSWGSVGNADVIVGTSSPGITNSYTGAASNASIKLQHNVDPSIQMAYNSFVSFPPTTTNNGNSTVDIKGRTVSILPTTGSDTTRLLVDGDVTASNISTDTLSPNTGGSIQMSSGNFELTGTGQVINNPNGIVEANEVAAPTILTDLVEPNTTTKIRVNGDTEVTASAVSSPAFKVWDGSYTDGGQPAPILTINSANDRTAANEAVTIQGGVLFAPGLNAEPADADTYPLFVTDAIEPRVLVFSQNDAAQSGINVQLNGSVSMGGPGANLYLEAPAHPQTGLGGDLVIQGEAVTIQSQQPIQFNSAMTVNGALLINSAIYQGQTTLLFPSASWTNQYDYAVAPLTAFTTVVNVDSIIGAGRTVNLLVEQNPGTGLIELQYSGGPAGTTKLFGPSNAVSGSYLTPSTTPGSYSFFELKAFNPATANNAIIVTSYEPNLTIGDINQWQ